MSHLKQDVDLTFFVPCYNEEKHLEATLTKLKKIIQSRPDQSFEILVLDDCSTDASLKIAHSFAHRNPDLKIQVRSNETNRGLGFGYVDAAFYATGNYYMLINGDNPEPQAGIEKILDQIGNTDIVIPHYGSHDFRSVYRRLLSKLFTKLINVISGHKILYYNGPVVHKRFNIMRWHPMSNGFAYQAELITILLDQGKTYCHIQIENHVVQEVSKAFKLTNILSVLHSISQIFLRRVRDKLFNSKQKNQALRLSKSAFEPNHSG
jgi:glycosyltransferase involved in cell wall biosynthesis